MSLIVAQVASHAAPRGPAIRVGLALTALALMLPLVAAPAAAQADPSAPSVDLAAQGEELVGRFLTILSEADEQKRTDLEAFLAPEFQLLRSDGTLLTRDAYLDNPASVVEYAIDALVVTGSANVIVTSYLLHSTVTIDGATRTTTAPRLTVFARHGEEWLMAAHANFTPLDDVPTASPDS